MIFLRHHTTGDGLLTALLTLKALLALGGDLAHWYEALPMYPQILLNVRVSDKARVMANPRLGEAIREAEARLGEGAG